MTCILFRSENKRNFFLFQVLPNTWYKYIFPTTSSTYTRTDLRIFEQTKVWKCDQISQLLLCRSYIEKVWNIVTHEGNTKLPFALEHIRTTMFGAWESTCEELCFEKGNTDYYLFQTTKCIEKTKCIYEVYGLFCKVFYTYINRLVIV